MLSPACHAKDETYPFGRFGVVTLYQPVSRPSHLALVVSGETGWNQQSADLARALSSLGVLVAGIDLPYYLQQLDASEDWCSYPGGDFERLSKFLQKKFDFPAYQLPVLVGYAAGATLAYATIAQAPPNMFLGAISLKFCPALRLNKPLCQWNNLQWTLGPEDHQYQFLPANNLPIPWVIVQGVYDEPCPVSAVEAFAKQIRHGEVVQAPQDGGEASAPMNWLPTLKHVFATLVEKQEANQPYAEGTLADLPLIEIPAAQPGRSTLAVILSGDGGWASIDRDLADTLASQGVSVVGLNSLRYFWTRRTPEGAARDLERILRHYLDAWRKTEALLIGYSLGADVLPFMANRLSPDVLSRVRGVALLGPALAVKFEFHLTDWLKDAPETGRPILPEVEKLRGKRMLCVYGEEEKNTLCTKVDPALADVIRLTGGHHFDGSYDALARTILREAGVPTGAQNNQ
jgi:type IV secretory pathway VirJ component